MVMCRIEPCIINGVIFIKEKNCQQNYNADHMSLGRLSLGRKLENFTRHTSILITPTHVVLLLRFLEALFPRPQTMLKYWSSRWTNLRKINIVMWGRGKSGNCSKTGALSKTFLLHCSYLTIIILCTPHCTVYRTVSHMQLNFHTYFII